MMISRNKALNLEALNGLQNDEKEQIPEWVEIQA